MISFCISILKNLSSFYIVKLLSPVSQPSLEYSVSLTLRKVVNCTWQLITCWVHSTIDVRHLIKHKVRSYRTLYVLEHQLLHEVIHQTVISKVLLWIKSSKCHTQTTNVNIQEQFTRNRDQSLQYKDLEIMQACANYTNTFQLQLNKMLA